MEKLKLFIIAGEKSGDNHASALLSEIQKYAETEVSGTGGAGLKALGQKQFYDINEMNAIGIDEAIRKLPFLLKVRDRLVAEIKQNRPDAVILVDYPGFNLRFARYAKELGIPVIFYISPTFWAWHYSRVKKLKQFCDLVLCIYPFEPEMLKKEGVNAVYVGNPLKKQINIKCADMSEFLAKGNFSGEKPVIGLLPGSRRREVESLLPVMVETAKALPMYDYVIGVADTIDEGRVRELIKGTQIRLATGLTHDIMKYSHLLWICSGTATLEAAIIGTPMVLMYRTGALTYALGQFIVRTKYIGMPNIIMKKAVIPELIQGDANARNLANFTKKIEDSYETVKADLKTVGDYFPDTDASAEAAKEIYSFLKNPSEGN
ncbi:lipid-A-disaccharide synthase [Seleniivibrio woodruffii]|uniref:Lipid-A-disaccharide synthase n=1 Tax=Seleniivibrio woodruffii TaxID=1078050 RepID=A0A4R1K6G3_9BACT|nr:lipid-A-disaccharide synthase [Seleniivibrio woodruffii]TCK59570.1 lipid-A-disaccharide synthase [Seleniivibrio woodruffii]TVZ35389.1 lipid-A-disaccharide synthase [Seleniivibrio woodruffii]